MTSVAEACKPYSDAFAAAVKPLRELRYAADNALVGRQVIGGNGRPGTITAIDMNPTEDDLTLTITWGYYPENKHQPNSYVSPKHELYTMTAVTLAEE